MVEGRGRLLVVQKTGWGKSSVYFIATKLLREQGAGPALLISPLLALMRNQIAAAERMGVRALTINSENIAEWEAVEAKLARDEVDIPSSFLRSDWRTNIFATTCSDLSQGAFRFSWSMKRTAFPIGATIFGRTIGSSNASYA